MAQRTRRAMTVLQVRDVEAARDFYARLGFASHGVWTEEGSKEVQFCIVQRGEVTLALQLSRAPELARNTHWAAYVYVDDVTALEEEFQAAGITLARLPEDAPYGCRDFDVTDIDGHLIAFGQDLHVDAYGPGLGPERGKG
ncbi:MAG: VOC family protein [Pseudomonadota bacterium]